MSRVTVSTHPLIQHKLHFLRDVATPSKVFRELVSEIATLLAYEATRDLELAPSTVRTPLAEAPTRVLAGQRPVVVPILRAGLGMVPGVLHLLPVARVGHIGLRRNEETLQPEEYYANLPERLGDRVVLLVDPMLATGGSATAAIRQLKGRGARRMKLICIIAAPEGIRAVGEAHPDVEVHCAVVDECLNDKAYIVPGLGDAGDRIFGTTPNGG
ncbi:MAG: uracil phosphoribosyltransferase [Planctomycetes bacterium]|nr:uracil phosphoribosyltransferase [Planctomycetota bacterium]